MLASLSRRRLLSALGPAAVGLLAGRGAGAEPLEFTSPYNFVFVQKDGSLVTFGYALQRNMRLSMVDLANPAYQVLFYTRYYYAAELIRPDPQRVLMAGLGAGAFHRLYNRVHPEARQVTVEIDPMILRLAQEQADFRPGRHDEVVTDDARIFLRKSRETYDWILLDTFDRQVQIPVHLTTREFFQILRGRLAEDGVMLANVIQGSRFFASYVMTVRAVFPDVVLLPDRNTDNVIVAAAKSPATRIPARLAAVGDSGEVRFQGSGVDLAEIARSGVDERGYLPRLGSVSTVLTDDYAPVESLDRDALPFVEPGQTS